MVKLPNGRTQPITDTEKIFVNRMNEYPWVKLVPSVNNFDDRCELTGFRADVLRLSLLHKLTKRTEFSARLVNPIGVYNIERRMSVYDIQYTSMDDRFDHVKVGTAETKFGAEIFCGSMFFRVIKDIQPCDHENDNAFWY